VAIRKEDVAPTLRSALDARKGGGIAAAAFDRHPAVGTPPSQKAEPRSALQSADLKVGATIPFSYRVEDKIWLAKDHHSLKQFRSAANRRRFPLLRLVAATGRPLTSQQWKER
jgi:hypothetical protein